MKNNIKNGSNCGIYGLGFIGALIYFLQGTTGFWPVMLAIVKSIAWPGFFVYHLFKFLNI